jgi:hypothetical protein
MRSVTRRGIRGCAKTPGRRWQNLKMLPETGPKGKLMVTVVECWIGPSTFVRKGRTSGTDALAWVGPHAFRVQAIAQPMQ